MTTIDALLQRAVDLHRAGNLAAAASLYRDILRADPRHVDARHLYGLARLRLGDAPSGRALIRTAVSADPSVADWQTNLGHAEAACGDPAAAAVAYRRALALRADQHAARLSLYHLVAASIRNDPAHAGDRLAVRPQDGPRTGSAVPTVSVVICSIDAAKYARVVRNYEAVLKGAPHEIIGIHDARSLCEGYARGFARSSGGILIFSHDDIEILNDDFHDRLLSHMAEVDLLGVAGTTLLTGPSWFSSGWPYQFGQVAMRKPTAEGPWRAEVFGLTPGRSRTGGIQALDGLFMAARRDLVAQIGWDQATFDGFHLYDIDFSWRAHRAGARVAVAHDLWLLHDSAGNMGEAWWQQALRFLAKHADSVRQAPQGPNPARYAMLATRDQVRAHYTAVTNLEARAAWSAPAA